MNKHIIVHIPHSSLNFPDIFYNKLLIDKKELDNENIFVSDYLIDRFIPSNFNNIIKFKFSRLFCDVERFPNDKLEVMSKYGMGVIYSKTSKGKTFIKYDKQYKSYVLKNYYFKHHKKIENMISKIIKKHGECTIIDLHSFSDEFVKKILKLENNPDICIGFDEKFKDIELIEKTIKHFQKYKYTVRTNYPYSGSFIPDKYFRKKDLKIKSIMIEINKRIYLDNNCKINNQKFINLKNCMNEYYKII